MKIFPVPAALLFLSGLVYFSSAQAGFNPSGRTSVADSVGIEKKDGKRFILHRVDEGQTLYAIARRYGRSVADIKAANPDMKDAVRYDQLVRVPISEGTLSRKEEKSIDKAIRKQEKAEKREAKVTEESPDKEPKKTEDPARAGIHVVEAGQTLYSLASRYGVSQSDLRKWNNLPTNSVLIGQALIVSEKAYLDRTPSAPAVSNAPKPAETSNRPTVTHPAEPHTNAPRSATPVEPKPERRSESEVPNRPTPPVTDNRPSATTPKPAEVEVESPRPGNDAPMPTRGRRISTSGVAEMIEGTDGSGKYLALHRTAPIGTLVQVRNEFNNQSLWVKVIGRLPNTGVNDKILIKLSTQAFAKLSPEDRRFRAEVSYIVK